MLHGFTLPSGGPSSEIPACSTRNITFPTAEETALLVQNQRWLEGALQTSEELSYKGKLLSVWLQKTVVLTFTRQSTCPSPDSSHSSPVFADLAPLSTRIYLDCIGDVFLNSQCRQLVYPKPSPACDM